MMKRFLFDFFIIFMFLSYVAHAEVEIITDDEKTLNIKNNKITLKQTWIDKSFELNPSKKFGVKTLNKVDCIQYKDAISNIDSNILDSIGNYKVYFLDYKLSTNANVLGLSFRDNSTVIFGTYYTLSEEVVHNLAIHEIGHIVDFNFMNDELWKEYKKIRKIEDSTVFNNGSDKIYNRPQEIFAEDFRILYGGDKASKQKHINSELEKTKDVYILKNFFDKIFDNLTEKNEYDKNM